MTLGAKPPPEFIGGYGGETPSRRRRGSGGRSQRWAIFAISIKVTHFYTYFGQNSCLKAFEKQSKWDN